MVIAIGSDHGGFEYKEKIKTKYSNKLYFVDLGAYEFNPTDDYVDFAFEVAQAVAEKKAELGIFICRTGVGAVIAMNKVNGIFAGLAEGVKAVELARKKNNINVLAFGADNVSEEESYKLIETFVSTKFEGGRHQRRVDKIVEYEKNKNQK